MSDLSDEQRAALLALGEAVTEAIWGCESEVTGDRLDLLSRALDRCEEQGLVWHDAQLRGQWPRHRRI